MKIPDRFTHKIREHLGESGNRWLRQLPTLVEELSRRWQVTIGEPFALSYNYVARARRRDGTEAVFKAAPPWGDGEAERESHALRQYAGVGICRLLEADVERRAMLLERLQPGEMLPQVAETDDDAATRIGADVMRRLWRPAADLPDPSLFKPLAEWFDAFSRHRAEYGGPGPFPAAVLDRAEALAADLLASSPGDVLLHGDFHHYNVLSSQRAGWLAIDPKGMLGDPGYEMGPFLLNPYTGPAAKSRALLDRRLDIFAAELTYDRRRLRDWAFAHAVLSACWSAEGTGGSWQRTIGAAENLIGL